MFSYPVKMFGDYRVYRRQLPLRHLGMLITASRLTKEECRLLVEENHSKNPGLVIKTFILCRKGGVDKYSPLLYV